MSLEELAIWMNCNTMVVEPLFCVINTIIVAPGLLGFLFILFLYIPISFWLLWWLGKKLFNK